MNSETSTIYHLPRPALTAIMILCGIGGTLCAATAGAADRDEIPSISVKYDPQSLATDSGARTLYRRLVKAAEQACPDVPSGTRLVSGAIRQCREEALARAVQKVNDPRLATLLTNHGKSG